MILQETPSGRLCLSSPEKPGTELRCKHEDLGAAAGVFARLLERPAPGHVASSSPSTKRGATTTRPPEPTSAAPVETSEGGVEMNGLLTIRDAAKLLALSDSMVRKLMRARKLCAVRIGRSVRVRADDVNALISAGRG